MAWKKEPRDPHPINLVNPDSLFFCDDMTFVFFIINLLLLVVQVMLVFIGGQRI